jgi:hypothetical protein
MKQILLDAFLPVFSALATAVVPVVVALAYDRFRRWTGMEIEARHREALQSALANAARLIAAGATTQTGISYVLDSVPDALQALKVKSKGHIQDLLEPHLAAKGKGAKPASAGA